MYEDLSIFGHRNRQCYQLSRYRAWFVVHECFLSSGNLHDRAKMNVIQMMEGINADRPRTSPLNKQ